MESLQISKADLTKVKEICTPLGIHVEVDSEASRDLSCSQIIVSYEANKKIGVACEALDAAGINYEFEGI